MKSDIKVDGLQDLELCAASCLHDLLNPLTSLSLYIELLSQEKNPSYDLKHLSESSAEITKFSKQISLFLKGSTKIEVFDIPILIRSTALLLHTELRKNNIEFIIKSKGIIKIQANPLSLQRIFLNILSNSIDSYNGISDRKKKIIIDIKSDKENINIYIKDYGCGMDKKILSKCLDLRFTNKPNGNGIGLWNVGLLVRKLNGTIKIASTPDSGTCVNLKFPTQCKK